VAPGAGTAEVPVGRLVELLHVSLGQDDPLVQVPGELPVRLLPF
jgi:hypothetical protein